LYHLWKKLGTFLPSHSEESKHYPDNENRAGYENIRDLAVSPLHPFGTYYLLLFLRGLFHCALISFEDRRRINGKVFSVCADEPSRKYFFRPIIEIAFLYSP